MNPRVAVLLDARARARAFEDRGLERAVQADLDRLGYQDPPGRVVTGSGMETTAVRAPERAVPQAKQRPRERGKGGRPPAPRCKHGQVEGRCRKCERG